MHAKPAPVLLSWPCKGATMRLLGHIATASIAAYWVLLLNPAASRPTGGPSPDIIRAGAAAVKITPPAGVPMAGYYSVRLAEGTHDDLYAKAIVIECGGQKAAVVALDLISTTREMVLAARNEIDKTTDIRGENVMIS